MEWTNLGITMDLATFILHHQQTYMEKAGTWSPGIREVALFMDGTILAQESKPPMEVEAQLVMEPDALLEQILQVVALVIFQLMLWFILLHG